MRKPLWRSERRGSPADFLVVGLGNPGREFEGTLHNAGADVIDILADRHGALLAPEKGLPARIASTRIDDHTVALAILTSYMNESGPAVRRLVTRFGIEEPATLIVVHDELDLPPGTVRLKEGGGLAGHNGLRSIKASLETDAFLRVRIGVGKPPRSDQGASHVLARPPRQVRELLEVAVVTAADAVERLVTDGVEGAMQWCHSLP